MNNSLRFHIDSQRAYDVNKASEQAGMDRYEAYVTGGNKRYEKAYAEVKRPDLGEDVI